LRRIDWQFLQNAGNKLPTKHGVIPEEFDRQLQPPSTAEAISSPVLNQFCSNGINT